MDRLEGSEQRTSWLVEFLVDVVPEPEARAIARAPLIVDAELRALVAFEVVVLAERAIYRVAETSDGLDANGFRCIETLLEQVVLSVVQVLRACSRATPASLSEYGLARRPRGCPRTC